MQRARSTRARLLTGALVLVLVGIGVIATLDAVRSAFRGGPSETRERTPALSASVPAAPADSSALLRHFRARGIAGVLVYSDPLDGCRLHALELPTLHDVAPPKLRLAGSSYPAFRARAPRPPASHGTRAAGSPRTAAEGA